MDDRTAIAELLYRYCACADRHDADGLATSHLLANVTIAFEGADRARAASVVHAWHRPLGGGTWTLYAEYHDVVVKTPGGWLIAERRPEVAGADGFPPDWRFHALSQQCRP